MVRIGVGERRARLGVRHRLAAPRADDPREVARALVALHGTDPATVVLSAAARLKTPDIADIERAIFDDLVRMLCMRRTVFTLPADLAPVAQAACGDDIARLERRRTLFHLDQAGLGDDAWLKDVEEETLAALRARGEAYATDLSADVPRLRSRIVLSEGKPYESRPAIAARVLLGLAAEGRIRRGRPRGSWTSSQFSWSPAPAALESTPPDEARKELVRRWLAAYGPGTEADVKWWTGLTLTQVRKALKDAEEVDLDGTTGYVLPGDTAATPAPEPWVALLPSLDPTIMGWAGRDWYLGDHGPRLFDRNGNAGPTVWHDGRIIGGWAQRETGEIVHRLFEDIGTEAEALLAAEAERLTTWLGPVRVKPRMRTPLERELTA